MSKLRRHMLIGTAAATVIVAAAFFIFGGDRAVTEEMVARVTVGMTQGEVETILGKPQESRTATATVNGKSRTTTTWMWGMKKGRAVVEFEEGRVVRVERL